MAITKEKKKEIVAQISDALADAKSVTFVQFDKLSVAQADALRTKLREEGVGYKVLKKTLLKIALDNAGYTGELPPLEGNIAVAYSSDELASAREVYEFHKDNKDNVKIVGGIFAGEFKDEESMNEIATIPGLQTLRGMFVNVINSPIQGFVVALNAIAENK
ncbi:MAG: 50S ribosomal protein L10 [Candidatus Nomurabacteria bacterium]|nr:50S ribosomal protein L10 [Candidatus Nomurabacteria bacterium]